MADPSSRAGARYATQAVLDYTARIHAPHDEALQRAVDAPEQQGMPAIQVGPSEGRALELLLRLVGARKVVEIGTLAGYSALWMARALPPGGRIWTLENDPKHAAVAQRNLQSKPVEVVEGDALESLATLEPEGPFCAVFIDADKARYDQYGRWAARNLRPGGLLIGDNAFFFGDLLADGQAAQAMRTFHEEVIISFDSVCLPTPDGLVVGIRRDESQSPGHRRTSA